MERFIKAVKVLKILGILIVVGVIFYVTDYVIYRKTGNSIVFFKTAGIEIGGVNTSSPENTSMEEEKTHSSDEEEVKQVENKIEEIPEITNFLNDKENNGFILSVYKEPKEIEPYYIFARQEYAVKDDAIIKQYENLTNTELTASLYRVSIDKAIEVISNKTGVDFSKEDIRDMMVQSFQYLPLEDSYYTRSSNDLYAKVKCTKIEEVGDRRVVTYEPEGKNGNYVKGVVTLKRDDSKDKWLFVSNKIIDKNIG